MAIIKEEKKKLATVDMANIALGAVLVCLCSWISIPATVPFTMQTFAVFFVLAALGGKRATAAILVYIALGAVGVPVFSQFRSGVGMLLGSTGGYIVGFVFMGLSYWLITGLFGKKLEIPAMVVSLLVLYIFGTAWFMVVYTRANGAAELGAVLSWCVLPFVVPDLIKMGLAVALARRLAPILKLQ